MAIIDVVKWDGDPDLYAWKFPHDNLSTLTQLIVNESQEACLYAKGQMAGKFGAGKHTLKTENIPIIRNLFGLPFGGDNPFTAQVWFVNKAISLDVKWGTPTPIQVKDPEYNIMVPVRGFGQFGLQIEDAEKFLIKLVGTMTDFNKETMSSYFKGILLKNVGDAIAEKIMKDKISVLEISMELNEISAFLDEKIGAEFAEFGVKMISFTVTSINVPEDDSAVKKLKEILARKLEMDTLGFDYKTGRSFDVMEQAASNEGGMAGGMMGAGMGLGMGMGAGTMMGGVMQNMVGPNMQPQQQQMQQGGGAMPPPMPGAVMFYVMVGGQQAGPYDVNTLQGYIQQGQVTAESMVWKQGMPQWAAANSVPELAQLFQQQGPPPPPPPAPGNPPPPPAPPAPPAGGNQ